MFKRSVILVSIIEFMSLKCYTLEHDNMLRSLVLLKYLYGKYKGNLSSFINVTILG